MTTTRHLLAAAILSCALALAACGEDDDASSGAAAAPVRVVATTTQVADLARNVGGDRATVVGLLSANADPHDYEVRPRDVEAIAEGDLVIRSGGDLDAWLDEAVTSAGADGEVVTLIDSVTTLPGLEAGEETDPHWWQDPRNAQRAVASIRDALTEADPAGAAAYRANAAAYTAELRRLDAEVAACIDRVPPDRRKLVTSHDALGYYADRYGLKVIGAVIPSLSTAGQPSAGETEDLVETIRSEGVTTVFPESSVNPKVERAIAAESGARIGRALWADTLGPDGSDGDTYLKSISSNTAALVEGFTAGTERCRPEA